MRANRELRTRTIEDFHGPSGSRNHSTRPPFDRPHRRRESSWAPSSSSNGTGCRQGVGERQIDGYISTFGQAAQASFPYVHVVATSLPDADDSEVAEAVGRRT